MKLEYKSGVLVSKLIETLGPVLAILLVWGVLSPEQAEQAKELATVLIPLIAAGVAWIDRKGVEKKQEGNK